MIAKIFGMFVAIFALLLSLKYTYEYDYVAGLGYSFVSVILLFSLFDTK